MKIEKWHDLCCYNCGRRRSTDFERGMSSSCAQAFRKIVKAEGWKTDQETN